MSPRAIVTGAAGFIGSTLAERLVRSGTEVVAVDSIDDYYDQPLKRHHLSELRALGATIVQADLLETDLDRLLDEADLVFHLAGQPGVRSSWGNGFARYTRNNIDATQRLIEAVRRAERIERFVYSSSSSIYGQSTVFPMSEELLPRPHSPYGVTKLAGEQIVSLYRSNFGVPAVSLRYFTVFGPRQRPDMAFTRFLRAAHDGSTVRVFGDGGQQRDFTFVDDIVEANIAVATARELPPAVMNVSGGAFASVNDAIATINSLSRSPIRVDYVAAADGDVRRTSADVSLIGSALGWRARVGLREGLERQWEWLLATEGSSARS